jgi:hypothetical protein
MTKPDEAGTEEGCAEEDAGGRDVSVWKHFWIGISIIALQVVAWQRLDEESDFAFLLRLAEYGAAILTLWWSISLVRDLRRVRGRRVPRPSTTPRPPGSL